MSDKNNTARYVTWGMWGCSIRKGMFITELMACSFKNGPSNPVITNAI